MKVKSLKGLTDLQKLRLDGTQVSDLSPLRGLANLKGLYLIGTQVIDVSPLQGLMVLRALDLAGTPVTDLSPLKELINLTQLNLVGYDRGVLVHTKVTDEEVKRLQKALPNCWILRQPVTR